MVSAKAYISHNPDRGYLTITMGATHRQGPPLHSNPGRGYLKIVIGATHGQRPSVAFQPRQGLTKNNYGCNPWIGPLACIPTPTGVS